jgi:colanic acid biosynthesis glycosyl transferase WcaI
VPIIYTPNAYFRMGSRGNTLTGIFNIAERFLSKIGHTINVSADEAAFARTRLGVSPQRQLLIYNAIDTRALHQPSAEERSAAREQFGLPANALVLGCVARDSFQKNLQLLYQAAAKVMAQRNDVWLLHVGEGDLSGLTDSLGIASRVRRINYLSDTAPFFHAIDAFAMPSRYEGLSFAILEALGSDRPIIITDVPGNREFLSMGLSHVWCAPNEDVAAFARSIEAWLGDLPANRPSNHQQIADLQFGYDKCYGEIRLTYSRLVAAAKGTVSSRFRQPASPEAPKILQPARRTAGRSITPRVLIISNLFAPDELGGAALATDLVTFLNELHCETKVLTTFPYYPQWRLAEEDRWQLRRKDQLGGIDVHRVRMYVPQRATALTRILSDVSFFFSLVLFGRFGVNRPDVLVVTCPMLSEMLAVRFLFPWRKPPTLLIVQDFVVDAALDLQLVRGRFLAPFLRWIESVALRGAQTITTISVPMLAKLQSKVQKQRTLYVPNWIHDSLAKTIARLRLHTGPRTSNRLFYSGNIGRKQGLAELISIFEGTTTGWHLAIHGGGADLQEINDLCEKRRDISVGPVLTEAAYVTALLQCSACLIAERPGMSSNALPSKILPALASGTPILAVCERDSPLGREVIEADCGVVIEAGDAAALRATLQSWAAQPEQLLCYSDHALARAERYERSVVLNQYLAEILVLAGRRPAEDRSTPILGATVRQGDAMVPRFGSPTP